MGYKTQPFFINRGPQKHHRVKTKSKQWQATPSNAFTMRHQASQGEDKNQSSGKQLHQMHLQCDIMLKNKQAVKNKDAGKKVGMQKKREDFVPHIPPLQNHRSQGWKGCYACRKAANASSAVKSGYSLDLAARVRYPRRRSGTGWASIELPSPQDTGESSVAGLVSEGNEKLASELSSQ